MNERLKWIMERLQKLQDNDHIRQEGWTDFQEAKAELADIIANPPLAAPPIVQHVMTGDDVEALAASVAAKVEDGIHASDVEVLAAIDAKGNDIIAAIHPA